MVQGTDPLPTPEIRISLGSTGEEEILAGTLSAGAVASGAVAAGTLLVNGGIAGGSGEAASANRGILVPVKTSNNTASQPKRFKALMPGSSPGHSFLSAHQKM